MRDSYQITDPDGDSLFVERAMPEELADGGFVYVRADREGVFARPEDLRAMAEAAEEIAGVVGADRLQPSIDDEQEGKGDVVEDIRKATHDPEILLPLVRAAKDLVRQALPEGANGVVVLDLSID